MRLLTAALVLFALVLAACGPAATVTDVGEAPSAASPSSAPSDASDGPPSPSPTADVAAGDQAAATDVDSGTIADTDGLPGTPAIWADRLNTRADGGVTGVEAGDVLNVRSLPGPQQPIVDRLAPLYVGLHLTGEARMVGDAPWVEITTGDTTGWVHSGFVNLVAGTDDITAEIRDAGVPATVGSLQELAEAVVHAYGLDQGYRIVWGPSRDPAYSAEAQRRVVVSDGPSVGDVGQITIDVIDLFDDSVSAERLAIFAEPEAEDRFALRAVERTFFCDVTRGAGEVCA